MISFLLNEKSITLADERADLTVLNFLREQQALTGTKEGCASGDCGACTVVLAELNTQQNSLHYRAINSCVTFMSALHAKQLITVEGLRNGSELHPVQQAMVAHHASQCGFCTPGFVMSIFALYHAKRVDENARMQRDDVINALSGNLCRCTGYRPIIDAAIASCTQPVKDKFSAQEQQTIDALKNLHLATAIGTSNIIMPQNRQQMAQAINAYPDAPLVAGSTDLALNVTQHNKPIDTLISVSAMAELNCTTVTESTVNIGAACPLNDVSALLIEHFGPLKEIIERFAAVPIRNQATLGGNIANASPIGDMPPVLIALNASIRLDNGAATRMLKLNGFFRGYKQTQLAKNEWITDVVIPRLQHNMQLRVYKVSKRFEDDISAVCAAFTLSLHNGVVTALGTGFGGVAAIPSALPALEDALVGKRWAHKDCLEIGKQILAHAFTPIDDVRASATYRNEMLANLWHRFWLETSTQDTRIPTRVSTHA